VRLTPNFTLQEFLADGVTIDDLPDSVLQNLWLLAQRLQVVRDFLGVPITITSGYRDPEHNKRVGGSPNSYHIKGMAADFTVLGMPANAVQGKLSNWSGGLGSYGTWTHVDIREKRARWNG